MRCDMNDRRIEKITLEDGRRAERHTYRDDDGREIVEVYSEVERPLNLERRIVREFETVVASETVEDIHDGIVVGKDVRAVDAAPLRVVERVKYVDAEPEPVIAQAEPKLSAMSIVEANVAEKSKNDKVVNWVLGGIVTAQVTFLVVYVFVF